MVFTRRNLDWWCERGILALVLALLIFAPLAFGGAYFDPNSSVFSKPSFAPWAFGAVYVGTFPLVLALVTGIAALWLVRLWGGHKPKLLWPPLAWAVVAFVAYAVGRYFTADIEYVARQQLTEVLLCAVLFLAVASNLYGQEAVEIVAYTLTVVAALTSSYALAQLLHHSNQVWNLTSPYAFRASGTYINPDHFAGFLELVLPLPLAFLMAGRVGVVTRVLLAYATLTILGGLAVTFSRGGWVAAAAGILMLFGFLLCHRNHSLRALLVLLALLAVGGFSTTRYLSHSLAFKTRVEKPDENGPAVLDTSSRLEMWRAAWRMCRDHPWWGVGPGHFDYRFREYRPESFQLDPVHAHDDYLELLADWGAAGGVIVLCGIGIFIVSLARTWPHVRREEDDFGFGMSSRYAFFLGALSGLFALAVHSLVDFNLHVPANTLTGVTVLGLLASNVRFSTKRYWRRARLPLQCAATVIAGGLILYFTTQSWRRGGEALWTWRMEQVKMGPDYALDKAAMLQKALAIEPGNFLTAYDIGESYRLQSLDGGKDYASLAETALKYYAQGMKLDPYDGYCQLRTGMCLDWLGRHGDAEKYYNRAETLDPNGNFMVANIGWHFVQVGDYSAARQWFIRAIQLNGKNQTALDNLQDICQPRLEQRASGQLPMSLFYSSKGN